MLHPLGKGHQFVGDLATFGTMWKCSQRVGKGTHTRAGCAVVLGDSPGNVPRLRSRTKPAAGPAASAHATSDIFEWSPQTLGNYGRSLRAADTNPRRRPGSGERGAGHQEEPR